MTWKRKCSPVLVPCFLMATGFFKMTMRHVIMPKKCSTGAELLKLKELAAQSPDLNSFEDLCYRVSCLISKNKSKAKKELIEQVIAV